ncbi:hypothetical protein GCM10017044_21310 [Kordiimonas sediminis]|uniref:Shikimate kinase n=1 Tax=Kordiimonas sediminis TaxID=1735581 RepID=A0A919AVT6_9PROT|nr:hypothetical protein [Kordiimonas sediminis]GHF26164.1 hypothetical protein GCM10017044_21310 [Kordiimonas sediminis]
MSKILHRVGLGNKKAFQAFKYIVYLILFGNFVYFLLEDMGSSAHTFRDGIALTDIVNAFSASTDTLAWLILLLAFELETYAIPDEKFTKKVKWSLNIVAAVCYAAILTALNGYIVHASWFYNFDPAELTDACAYVGQILSAGVYLHEYEPLTLENCASYVAPLFINSELSILTSSEGLSMLRRLSTLDVVNASTWVLVVIVLAIDVYLQERGKLTDRLYDYSKRIKFVLYGSLFLCASYWAMLGDGIGTWDAAIWIIAFFFIEMNVQQWHEEESEKEKVKNTPVSSETVS